MSDIAFLIASSFHGNYLPSLLAEHHLDYPVYAPVSGIQTDEEAIACAQRITDEGAKVIITAGRFPELLLPYLNIPTLTLNYSSVSFARALNAARKISSRVTCFLRYGRIYNAALQYKSDFHDKVLVAGYEDEKDCIKSLSYLRTHHIEVIVCGGRGPTLVEKYGYQFECVQVSYESSDVKQAVSEAERIMHYTLQANRYNARLKAIQNGTAFGILAVDGKGVVEYANAAALGTLQVQREDIVHKSVEQTILRALSDLPQTSSLEPVRLGNQLLLASAALLPAGEGLVYTLMSMQQMQMSERKLRSTFYADEIAGNTLAILDSRNSNFLYQLELAKHYAEVDSPVLITGPSGSGKRTLAQQIHEKSRRTGPFITIHCASLAEDKDTETYLFGRQAVGGEVNYGQLELANGGTLYLSEIGACPAKLQAKLFQVLQTGAIIEPDSGKTIFLDIRIIASSRDNLFQLIREKRFREDLYYAVAVLQLNVPALEERPEDILPMLRHFLKQRAEQLNRSVPELRPEAEDHFAGLKYPGNVRQLANIAERLVVLGNSRPVDLPMARSVSDALPELPMQSAADMKQNVEAQLVREALAISGGNRAQAAKQLGISSSTLWRRMKAYGLS